MITTSSGGGGLDHTPLLMLHGSGGTEQDMVPLASQLAPASMAVAVRGAMPGKAALRSFAGLRIAQSMNATCLPEPVGLPTKWPKSGWTIASQDLRLPSAFRTAQSWRLHWSCSIPSVSPLPFFSGRCRHSPPIQARASADTSPHHRRPSRRAAIASGMALAWQDVWLTWAQRRRTTSYQRVIRSRRMTFA